MNTLLFLSLGSNLGDREMNIQTACQWIEKEIGKIRVSSSLYKTEPWGFQSDHSFLNSVIGVKTDLSPEEILKKTQEIEIRMGRQNKTQSTYSDRIIDIDIILFGDIILNTPELKIPHPLFHQRLFVLEPFNEIAPQQLHPVLNQTIEKLYLSLVE